MPAGRATVFPVRISKWFVSFQYTRAHKPGFRMAPICATELSATPSVSALRRAWRSVRSAWEEFCHSLPPNERVQGWGRWDSTYWEEMELVKDGISQRWKKSKVERWRRTIEDLSYPNTMKILKPLNPKNPDTVKSPPDIPRIPKSFHATCAIRCDHILTSFWTKGKVWFWVRTPLSASLSSRERPSPLFPPFLNKPLENPYLFLQVLRAPGF